MHLVGGFIRRNTPLHSVQKVGKILIWYIFLRCNCVDTPWQ